MLPTQQFQGESLLKGTHFGEGGRGAVLTVKALWFPFRGTHWFPRQRRSPASKVLHGDHGLASNALNNYPRPRLHHSARAGSELGGRGAKVSALQKCGHRFLSFPRSLYLCKQLLIPRSLLSRALWLSR